VKQGLFWVTLLAAGIGVAGGALRVRSKRLLLLAWLTPGIPPPGPLG